MRTTRPHRSRGTITRALLQRVTTVGLVACLLVLHAGLFSRVATHAFQHAHHEAATHASALCTWLCTAGEISEAVQIDFDTGVGLAGIVESRPPATAVTVLTVAPSSRAPPLSSV